MASTEYVPLLIDRPLGMVLEETNGHLSSFVVQFNKFICAAQLDESNDRLVFLNPLSPYSMCLLEEFRIRRQPMITIVRNSRFFNS